MAEQSGERRRGVPLSVRIAPDMHAEVIARAAASGQSITDQVNRLLAQAVAVENDAFMSPLRRHIARKLIDVYAHDELRFGGASGVAHLLLSLEDPNTGAEPDVDERERRRLAIIEMMMALHPDPALRGKLAASSEREFYRELRAEMAARKKPEPEKE
jgi:hypothetical protein